MKSFSVKSGFGIGIVIFAVASIIALPVRTLQFFTVLESGTGFFSEVDLSVYLLYAVIALAIAAAIVLGIAKRKKLDYSLEAVKRPGFGILSITSAVGALMDAANSIIQAMDISAESSLSYSAVSEDPLKSMGIIFIAEAIFAVLSAIFFFAIGISSLSGKTNGSEYRLISLAPVLWSVFRMVFRFTRTISYIRVSDLMFEMIMLVFMILFFMAFAQVNSQVNAKNNEWKLAAYGLPAALMALICFVPRFIVTLSGNTDLLYSYSTVEYCDFAVALFILATVLTRVTDKLPDTETEEKTEE